MAVAASTTWISHPEARRRLAIGRVAFDRLVAQGKLTVRAVPGSRPVVSAEEVDELAERSTRRATGGAATC